LRLRGETKFHEAIKVGDTVFDNLNPDGIKYDDWLNDLDFPENSKYGVQYLNSLGW